METQLKPSTLIPPEHILLDVDLGSKKRVFERIALLFENTQGIARKSVFDSLIARERLGSTVIGKGTAIPHGRMETLRQPVAAFVRLNQPIVFESDDREPVRNLFVIISPETPSPKHLRACSLITQMLNDPELISGLDRSPTPESAFGLIKEWEASHLGAENGFDQQLGAAAG